MSEQQSHAGRRPFLSRVAEQYVRSFSVFKQISLSAAASELVVRGAQSWLEQHQTETIPHVPADDPKAPHEAASFYLNRDIVQEIRRLGVAEGRSASHVATELLRVGLQAKAAAVKATAA